RIGGPFTEPLAVIYWVEDHRHAVVNRGADLVRLCRDDRERPDDLPAGPILPALPQAGKREQAAILHNDRVGLFGLGVELPVRGTAATGTPHGMPASRQPSRPSR